MMDQLNENNTGHDDSSPATAVSPGRSLREVRERTGLSVADVANHIDHIRKVAGIDHVAYGSDFDGITSTPTGLEDVSTFPSLTAELLRRGYQDDEVKKVLGLNMLRVMRAVEAVAAK